MPGASASGCGPDDQHRDVVAGPPAGRLEDRVLDVLGDRVGRQPRAAREQRGEIAVAEDLLAAGPHLGHAVRVEDDQLAGLEVDLDVAQHGIDVGAEQRAELADGLDRARAAQHERQRVPAAAQRHPRAAGADRELAVGDGAEAVVVARVAQRAVQQRQDGARARLVCRGRAERVAGERGHRGGLRPLAADVADQRRDAVAAGAEEVVEVAADLDPLARRDETHGGREARDRGRLGGSSERWSTWAMWRSRV